MINVTKTFLPPLEEYVAYLSGIWERAWVTNNGPLALELEERLAKFFDVPFVQFVSNGTIAIQLSLKCLDITQDVITTPFSYVATTTSLIWEHCNPVFVDIRPDTCCIDPALIEQAITSKTEAILATHVYGNPCDVEEIARIGQKYNLKVIYDAAHAFGTNIDGQSVLKFGDLSTLSFHATKIFHTIEGGAILGPDASLSDKLWLLKSFGHKFDDYHLVGINGKNSELHAAMGLCLLPRIEEFIRRRKEISAVYDRELVDVPLTRPVRAANVEFNYAYYPVIFKTEKDLLIVKSQLEKNGINTRRYFYPSLNRLPYLQGESCPVSEDISTRILCLPLYYELLDSEAQEICALIGKIPLSNTKAIVAE